MLVHAVLIDTISIQKYVFGSNKLKENLGASYLIQDIYASLLQEAVESTFPSGKFDFNAWRYKPDRCLIDEKGVDFEIAYIGGGKGLLFFKNKDDARKFIKEWTRKLLIEAPSVITAIASDSFDIDHFKEENRKLFNILQENKNRCVPQTVIPRHGITAECSRSGYSMDIWDKTLKDYVSSVTYGKLRYAEKSKENLSKKYAVQLSDKFSFTNDIEKLGQSKDEDSHIAIVHIDGNNMGRKFNNTETLEEIRKLSVSVENATENSFDVLLSTILSQCDKIEAAIGKELPKNEDSKKIVPLRPIIIGGDDITFVSDGKLGVYFAKTFLAAFETQQDVDGKDLNLTASAGIAITKTKYPFYRGYELSEQLCRNAKLGWSENRGIGSWLDFHIAYGGFSGTLEEIRKTHYTAEGGELFMRPYHIGGDNDELSFEGLIRNIGNLLWKDKDVRNFPRSKIMEMREILTLGEDARKTFVKDMKIHKRYIPEISSRSYDITLFENNKTPYLDMIELMEFYPSFELDK